MINIKALVLAAGYATRLYPLTKDKPKPLLHVAGKPMMEHIISKIEEVPEIDIVYVVTNEKFYSHFDEWVKSFNSSKEIKVINDGTTSNDDRLGAVGDIRFVIQKENIDDALMVIAGDNLFEFSLNDMKTIFSEKNVSVIGLRDVMDKALVANKLGVAIVDETSKVIDFEEKPAEPKSTLAATCCYLLAKNHVKLFEECLSSGVRVDNPGDFIKWLSKKEHVHGFVFSEKWFDIGSHEQYEHVNKIYGKK